MKPGMQYYIFICLLCAFFLVCTPYNLWAVDAESCSIADVTSAYNSATAGDTVNIPSGSCIWNSGLTITKAITIMGMGGSSTKIIRDTSYTGNLIEILLSSDVPVRISGISFDNITSAASRTAIRIQGTTNNSFASTKIRLDNNIINNGGSPIWVSGWVYGVIDHNTFLNCNRAILLVGDNNYAWGRTIAAGTANAMFIEDNIFTWDNNSDIAATSFGEAVYHQEGARSVTRYNTFDSTAMTGGSFDCFYDSHGNWPYYTGNGDYRGQPLIEVYNNFFHAYKTNRFMNIRGGSALIHNNTFTTVSGSPSVILLSEEESWQTLLFTPLRTAWPAEDQITNSFFWDNTLNESPATVSTSQSSDPTFIQENRDYFMNAPQATGGKSTYPTRPGADDMTFSSSGANAYYPYTPYTYPHPLRGSRHKIGSGPQFSLGSGATVTIQ